MAAVYAPRNPLARLAGIDTAAPRIGSERPRSLAWERSRCRLAMAEADRIPVDHRARAIWELIGPAPDVGWKQYRNGS
jgi:hypothetical protein